jgi:hypothetical protein
MLEHEEHRQKWAYFIALISVSLTLGPSLAHLLELPNKIGLNVEHYFIVQGIYRGWALLGIVVFASVVSTLTLAVLLRKQRVPMLWAALAFVCIVGAQILFWTYTFPANQATNNWTEVPPNWETLRSQWEYSHAAAALLNLLAMAALVVSVLSWGAGNRQVNRDSRG